jgi:hypothetical protein
MEGIARNCSLSSTSSTDRRYRRKHNPFVFFMSLRDSGQCAADDVPLTQLPGDLATASHTPNYAYIVPNQCNDAHDSCASDDPDGLKRADAFLKEWVPRILNSPAFRSDGLLIVTFDEADADSTSCCGEQPGPAAPQPGSEGPIPGPGGGATGAVLVSPFIKPGTVTANAYNHYSLLRSVEDFFGVAHLAFASRAGPAPFGTDVFTNPHAAGGSASSGAGSGSGASGTGPRPACRASSQPQTRFSSRRRTTRRRIELRGGALELGCSEPGGRPAVRVVLLSVARRVGRRCRFLRADGTATTARSCRRPLELLARGARSWRVLLKGRFAAGRYVARVRAIDVDGHRERTTSARNELGFTVG